MKRQSPDILELAALKLPNSQVSEGGLGKKLRLLRENIA
jgi:hypothetical protein